MASGGSIRLRPRTRLARLLLFVVFLALVYLVAWPVPVEPVAWTPPPAPLLTGPFAPNDRLKGVARVGSGLILGPEATAADVEGRIATGTRDGRLLRVTPATGETEELARTSGRPLGLAFDRSGRLLVCDEAEGLLALEPSGELRTLATGHGGVPFGFTNDVDVGPDGTVYFTDTTPRRGVAGAREEVLEHAGRGRLFALERTTGRTSLLRDGLQFANGVAVAGDGSFLVVAETSAYRLTRVFLDGPRRGTSEPFLENLPGLPDNVTWSGTRGVFWVSLYSPRVAALDLLAGKPFLRKVVLRLPRWVQPQPAHHAWVLAVDVDGRVVENLQDASPEAFAPVTSVLESGGFLWLGSLDEEALGKVEAPPLTHRSP